jgi:NADH-quinone oxidoreductase subunit I
MYGRGILRGLAVTLKHFVNTYIDDFRFGMQKYNNADYFQSRQSPEARGAYTVQYPDEKIAVPERFRFTPFLVVNDHDAEVDPGKDWCTSCGICAKVCPPQCIWIVRSTDPTTGRPVPEPEAFFIDIDICMNCGYCAEYCPFDAIKMDHDYEMASYDRTKFHIHDKERLSKEFSYWRSIAPTTAYEEMQARGGWEHTDVVKARKKGKKPVKQQAPALASNSAKELQEQGQSDSDSQNLES